MDTVYRRLATILPIFLNSACKFFLFVFYIIKCSNNAFKKIPKVLKKIIVSSKELTINKFRHLRFLFLELLELFRSLGRCGEDAEDVEADSLAQWPALPDRDLVAVLHTERWRKVCRYVLMPLLVSGVFGDEVEIRAADDDRAVHLGGDHGTS